MSPSTYIPIIVMFVILYILFRNRKAVVARKTVKKRRAEGKREMVELAKKFIGKECLISAFDSNHQFEGTIVEVSDGAILIENKNGSEVINLDFVIRIREFPRKPNGKKKSVILD